MLNFLGRYMNRALQTNHRSSAMSPLLWLNGIISFPSILASTFAQQPMNWLLFVLGAGVVIFTLKKYNDLSSKDPHLVQSERLQVEMAKIDLIARKGGEIIIDPVNIPLSEEPLRLAHMEAEDGGEQ